MHTKLLTTILTALFPLCSFASTATSVVTDAGAKLVIDCDNLTTSESTVTGGKLAEFIKAESLGCDNSLATLTIPSTSDAGVVTAGAFLLGTSGMEFFGKYLRSNRFIAKDIAITGVPKVLSVKSKSGSGASLKVTKVGAKTTTLAASEAGYYSFGVYGHVVSLIPLEGGSGYTDIESIELDWSGVTVTGLYAVNDDDESNLVWKSFSFVGSGTSSISGSDIRFTTQPNTSSGHCASTKTNDYSCTYSEDFKTILRLANVTNEEKPVSCTGVEDFIKDNPDLKDRFVCKKAGATIDCSTIERDTLVCKDKNGTTVSCTEAANQNACYASGRSADSEGFTCSYEQSGQTVSCFDAGFEGTCPAICYKDHTAIDCQTVVNLNACAEYGIYTDQLGYSCQINGVTVPCSTFGAGTCSESATCMKDASQITCATYENALACAEEFGFAPSESYWCKIGITKVPCTGIQKASSCDASSLLCTDTELGADVDCELVARYNMCTDYGVTADSIGKFECRFDDVLVTCLMAGQSGSCPLPKECQLPGFNKTVDCVHLDNATACSDATHVDYKPFYTCSKGNLTIDCATDMGNGTCDTTTCASACPYSGVTLDGTEDTCICREAPVCTGAQSVQTGNNYCDYGGSPKGNGTQDCDCSPAPDCSLSCASQGEPKKDGTSDSKQLPSEEGRFLR